MAERRILVVDDDKLIHAVIRAALAKGGYQVHSAFDSVQAAGAARQIKPALSASRRSTKPFAARSTGSCPPRRPPRCRSPPPKPGP